MKIKDTLELTEKQFDIVKFKNIQEAWHSHSDDTLRYPIIIKMLRKIKTLSKDFSLIDLGCGKAGVLNEIKKEFPHSDLHGADALEPRRNVKLNDDSFKFYNLDFMELLKLDFQCDVALMLNLYHHPGVFRVNSEPIESFMKNLETGISSNFDYFITLLNSEQYESFKNGISHYSKIPIKIIYEEPLPVGDNSISQWVVVKFEDNTK